jgi:hypothetical protein
MINPPLFKEIDMSIRMNTSAAIAALLMTTAAGAAAAQDRAPASDPQGPDYRAETPVVVQRGPNGRATMVRVGDMTYPVCQGEQADGCIQPRAAGLGWGDRPLQRWPGEARAANRSGR